MNKLNIFEKLVFSLAMLLLALVTVTEIFPSLWAVLPPNIKAVTFSGTEITMILLTAGIVFFAGMQAFLQRKHQDDARLRWEREHNWRMYEPRSQIYTKMMHCLGFVATARMLEIEVLDEFGTLMMKNGHCLPDDLRTLVNQVYALSHRYYELCPRYDEMQAARRAGVDPSVFTSADCKLEEDIVAMRYWAGHDARQPEVIGPFNDLLNVLEDS